MEMPAVSVIIPLYNREKYISECLDSLLAQTFKNFEVIVVDDCSTDSSVAVVESYRKKFGGRLKLMRMKKNSGHPGLPRNKGISFASGEFIYCLDSDDTIIENALETMFSLAKSYDADVVYCEKYFVSSGVGQEFLNNVRVADSRIQKPPFVDKPTLETDNLAERINKLFKINYWMSPALRLVKRELLIENDIKFYPLVGSEDDDWSMEILFCAKRFLRIPNACFIRRIHEDGISFGKYTTPDEIQRWMDRTIRSLRDMDEFMSGIEFFQKNPAYRYAVINFCMNPDFKCIFKACAAVPPHVVYEIFREKFGEYLGEHDVLVAALCTFINTQQKILANAQQQFNQFAVQSQRRIAELENEIKRLKSKE